MFVRWGDRAGSVLVVRRAALSGQPAGRHHLETGPGDDRRAGLTLARQAEWSSLIGPDLSRYWALIG